MKRVVCLGFTILSLSMGGMLDARAATVSVEAGASGRNEWGSTASEWNSRSPVRPSGQSLSSELLESASEPGNGNPASDDNWIDLDPGQGSIPLGLLFDSGTPVTDPNFTCGGCFAFSSTYFKSPTDYDLTARRFAVPAGSFASAFRLWWAYGEEGPHPNSSNYGGGPTDFSSITLDLYDASGPGGAPGVLLANLTGTWTTLDAPTHYKEFFLDSPYEFVGTDYYVSLRGETAESGYQATLLWLTCADPDPYIDYEDYFNPVNGTTSGWGAYPTLAPCYEDLDFGLQIIGGGTPDLVSLDPEPGCINATSPCRSIDFDFERVDTTPVRGFSVTFELTDLTLCTGVSSITEGPYLSGHCGGGCTAFEVIDNMDGTYTVDCAILGAGCGPDSSGTLFTVDVGSTLSAGAGTVEVTQVIVRDCVNTPVPGLAGDMAVVEIDTQPPPPVADLATVQKKTGNGTNGTTAIELTFTDVGAAELEVYRAPFGDGSGVSSYPEYDDIAGVPPTAPTYPPGPPWSLTAVAVSGDLDEPPTRGYWYYVVFTKDECSNVSVASNLAGGCLNYHLGDVSDGAVAGQGDNTLQIPDISLIGAHYGASLVLNDPVNYLDVGPTDDGSVDGLPDTDDWVDFEDLILFAINYGQVSLTDPNPVGTSGSGSQDGIPRLVLVPDPNARPGYSSYLLQMVGDGSRVQGVHAVVDLDGRTGVPSSTPTIPCEVQRLGLSESPDVFLGSYVRDASLVVDVVRLGSGSSFPGPGTVARIAVPIESGSESWAPVLDESKLRDVRNRELGAHAVARSLGTISTSGQAGESRDGPPQIELLGAEPNPFMGSTHIRFRTAAVGPIHLRIVDVRGRRVRDLTLHPASPGEHLFTWDGTTSEGQSAASGVYLYELRSGSASARGKVFLSR